MSFDRDGFLATDHQKWVDRVRDNHAPWLAFTWDINREAMRALPRAAPSQSDNKELIAALTFGRVLQSYQGTIVLAQRGLISDARTLIRSMAESTIALGGLAVGADFVDQLQEDHDKQVLSQANSLLKDSEKLAQNASAEQVERLTATVTEIKGRYTNGGPRKINWENVANAAGFDDLYDLIYRPTSGDGAHVSINGLNRLVEEISSGRTLALKFGPDATDLNDTLQKAAAVVLHALEAISRIFPQIEINESIHTFLRRYEILRSTG